MSGFLNSAAKSSISNLYSTLHETFARDITVYKTGKKILIATDNSYNHLYGKTSSGKDDSREYELISETFRARVYHLTSEQEYMKNSETFDYGVQNKIIVPNGSVKLVVESAASKFIDKAKRVELDGKIFHIKSDPNPDGFAENKFFTFFLTPIDE